MPKPPKPPRPPRPAKPPKPPKPPGSPTLRASRANFRVLVGKEEVGVLSVSSPHLLDPALRNQGLQPPPSVTLRRAVDANRLFYSWARLAQGGKPATRTVTLQILASPGGDPLYQWELRGARPLRWSGPALDAMDGNLAMEELELAYDTVEWS